MSGLPVIIQGGMGIGVSNWRLARSVSALGQLGVVSGTGIDVVFVRRLQDGDPGGHLRRAIAAFPFPDVGADALERYFIPDGRPEGTPYRLLSMWRQTVSRARERITMLASFAEVHLAKEGHQGLVGMNLLTKVQMPNLATLYGAMLAGVDYVLMGAGIPREIPGCLDAMAEHRPTSIRFDVEGEGGRARDDLTFDPGIHWAAEPPASLRRPRFLPIVASNSLARMLARKANGRVDGLVIEGPTAGGHNAPPRGVQRTNVRGEPIYGDRDEVDIGELRALGLPFWLAGGTGSPEAVGTALEGGAAGVQVGTLFAYAEESGIAPDLKKKVLAAVRAGTADVRTDPLASPTGFPFKIVRLEGKEPGATSSGGRERVCDLGYLRTPYRREDGRIGYRCPSEPVEAYLKKGGDRDATRGRRCLCNALTADIGHGQHRESGLEPPLLTSGDDLLRLDGFLQEREGYTAAEVVEHLLSALPDPGRATEPPASRHAPEDR